MSRLRPFSLAFLSLAACGLESSSDDARIASAWKPVEAPLRLEWNLETEFSALPLEGSLDVEPWADDYWADAKGGIARRVGRPGLLPAPAGDLSEAQVRALSPKALAALSPAEKLDIIMGDFSFSTVKKEFKRTRREGVAGWEGLCHGWANAALNFREPKAITFATTSGILLPLASSDLKAMLTWLTAESSRKRRSIGKTCPYDADSPGFATHPDCNDIHAGTFHVALANLVGVRKRGLVIDKVPEIPVWNHPIYAYSTQVEREDPPSPEASPEAVKELVVSTLVAMEAEIEPQWRSGRHATLQEKFRYALELNVNDEIVGGRWLSKERPDTLWLWDTLALDGPLSEVGRAYEQAVSANADAPQPQ